eukprot:gb/GECG01003113.1/.p1 GENE.gb/GECG01003113.1/~~gb/GECG01003113.1/.p1  ORF type:complete len:113 (+),score=11.90 gb/GECG01003113.1/:1-339(+)
MKSGMSVALRPKTMAGFVLVLAESPTILPFLSFQNRAEGTGRTRQREEPEGIHDAMHSAVLQKFVNSFDSAIRDGSEACVAGNTSVTDEFGIGNAPFKAGQTIAFPSKLFGK